MTPAPLNRQQRRQMERQQARQRAMRRVERPKRTPMMRKLRDQISLDMHMSLARLRTAPDDDARTDPASTLTTRDRLALVTVHIQGNPYVIVDIRLRMLTPAELYDLQGFPANYTITHGHDGRKFTKTQQVHMVGNSVSPPAAEALILANAPQELLMRKAA